MTLHSQFAVFGNRALDARKLFEYVQVLVETPEGVTESDWLNRHREVGEPRTIANPVGCGAKALMWVEFAPDGPMWHTCSKYCDEAYDPEGAADHHAAEVETHGAVVIVHMDTAYGYTDEFGGCAQLHSRLMTQLGQHVDALGFPRWRWYDEFNGEWHDRDEKLAEFA